MFSFLKMKFGFYSRYLVHKITIAIESIYQKRVRGRLKNKNFSIISNNCWGGSVYEDFGLNYTSPTIGLFFFAPCYIKFITDLKMNLSTPLRFVNTSKYDRGEYLQSLNRYPIGMLNDEIEIHFLHYNTEEEAIEKWNRRVARVNYDNLFFSFSDNEICTIEEIISFDKIPYKKVFFSAEKIEGISSLVHIPSWSKDRGVGNLYDHRWKYRKHFNVVKWLNSN